MLGLLSMRERERYERDLVYIYLQVTDLVSNLVVKRGSLMSIFSSLKIDSLILHDILSPQTTKTNLP